MTDQNEARTAGPGDARDADSARIGQTAQVQNSTDGATQEPGEASDKASSSSIPPNPDARVESGESGESGVFAVSNREFLEEVFNRPLPDAASVAICLKPGDPQKGGYIAAPWRPGLEVNPGGEMNAFVNCSVFTPGPDGSFRARKDRSAATVFLMLDDIGTKVSLELLKNITPSWLIETSPGNFQAGLILAEPVDGATAARLHNALTRRGFCDAGAGEPRNRWSRLPKAINGKPKHARDGEPWRCRLTEWNPRQRFTPDQIIELLDLELAPVGKKREKKARLTAQPERDTFRPAPEDNRVLRALEASGLYKRRLDAGKHDVSCPWASEHTDGVDNGAAYFEPSLGYPRGGFRCLHSHGDQPQRGFSALLEHLGLSASDAEPRPLIRVLPGQLARVVDASEQVLASAGDFYQSPHPALIVTVSVDPKSGDARIVVIKPGGLVYQLSRQARWEKMDRDLREWIATDPPARHLMALYERESYDHLPLLRGISRQPFFDAQGNLVTQPGYHAATGRLGVFDANAFRFGDFTREAAEQSLELLKGLLDEFAFATETDRAAAIGAMLTAAARPSLRFAPAFHIRAPEYGSGKSYLAKIISLFAGPAGAMMLTYPSDASEATKSMLAALMEGPAAIVFDDMQADWHPFGVINSLLTSETITGRVLGISQMATASTRLLLLATGNNCGPTGDLLRRVVTIRLDHGRERPAEKGYQRDPEKEVRADRGRYVTAALTIIAAYRAAGAPRSDCAPLAGYDDWGDACRQPLLWLGLPDPAGAVFEAMAGDEARDLTAALFAAWFKAFGGRPTTVRRAIRDAGTDLRDLFDDAGACDGDRVNSHRLGQTLKRAANRLAGGYRLEACRADGRPAWRVVAINAATPLSPLLTLSRSRPEKQRSDDDDELQEGVL